MKLSLSWIFNYIVNPLSRYDISDIVQRFNKTTAEIESWREVRFEKDRFSVGKVTSIAFDSITVHSTEWGKNIELPIRCDVIEGLFFIVKRDTKGYHWATYQDWHATKDGLLPSVYVSDQEINGGWKEHISVVDYIIEIDNKSITHRPDLWGHYGVAREIAAMLKIECHNQEDLYEPLPVHYGTSKGITSVDNPYSFEIQDTNNIKAFAGLYMSHVISQASVPWMTYALCLVDVRSINTIVDATNYTMYDIGHPLHAFNADAIRGKKLIARMANAGEVITLLDGETIQLDNSDIVIADNKHALSLAGIMGGKESAVYQETDNIVVEAACFDAATIRRSAAHHKKRTEAAVRFEKSLDPHQTICALRRYIKLLRLCGIQYSSVSAITALGNYPQEHTITVFHSFIQNRLGIVLDSHKIEALLSSLGFTIEAHSRGTDKEYRITVPSFRSAKDVRIKEDILEEIGRALGYDSLKPSTPCIKATLSDLDAVYKRRAIKNICSNTLRLQELYTYSLFDEHFLNNIRWHPLKSVKVAMPLSENRQQLVTTLIPQHLSVVSENSAHNDVLRFFELARVWVYDHHNVVEKKMLAGIIYHKKNDLTFYDGKMALDQLFAQLSIEVTWHKQDNPHDPWFVPYQTAAIHYKDRVIGRAGLAHPLFFEKIAPGNAYIFELDADFLIAHKAEVVRMKPLSKFPDIVRDMSLLVPVSITVATLQNMIECVDTRIVSVEVQDFFEKVEWQERRAVTFRYVIRDYEKTMTKPEIDTIHDAIVRNVSEYNVEIR